MAVVIDVERFFFVCLSLFIREKKDKNITNTHYGNEIYPLRITTLTNDHTILLWTKYNGDDDDDDRPSDQLVSLYKLFIFIFSNIPWVIFVFAFIQKSLFLFVYLFICPKCCLYSETPDHTTYNKRIVHYQFISISVCVCVCV